MVAVETPCIRIVYYINAELLLIKWLSKPDAAAFTEAYLQLLKIATINNVIKLYCTDLSCIGALSHEQEAWLNLEYYPMVYNAIKDDIHAAVVFSEEHFKAVVANYQVEARTEHYQFINLTYFTNLDEALYWLRSQKKGRDTAALPAAP